MSKHNVVGEEFINESVIFYISKSLILNKSPVQQFDNRPAGPTNKKPAAKAAGFVFLAAPRACPGKQAGKQNCPMKSGEVAWITVYLSSESINFFCVNVFFIAFSLTIASSLCINSKYSVGTTCHDNPYLSLHHPQEPSSPPFLVRASQ